MLELNRDNSNLIDFICLEKGEEMLQENSFFMTISILIRAFMIFCLRNKIKTKK